MAKPKPVLSEKELVQAAVEGLEAQRAKVEEQIREAKARLDALTGRASAPRAKKKRARKARKRKLSTEARQRISAAQKQRWAKFRKKSGAS